MVYPFGLGLYYSLTDYWLQFPKRFRFIWFDNYIGLFNEPLFTRALEFTLGFTLVAVVIQVGLGLAVALFLHAHIPGRRVMRAMMLMPLMIPPVITALMWKIMMASTSAGILNYVLSFLGIGPVNWLGLAARGDGLRPDHRYVGQPALRLADSAWRRCNRCPLSPTRRPGSMAPALPPCCATSRCRCCGRSSFWLPRSGRWTRCGSST